MKKSLNFCDFGAKAIREMAKGDEITVKDVPLAKLVSVQTQLSRQKRIANGFDYKSSSSNTSDGMCDVSIFVL